MSKCRVLLLGVVLLSGAFSSVFAQQNPGRGVQTPAGRGNVTPPALFFRETWRLEGRPHAIEPAERVLANPDLELKAYGACAAAADPDQRLWVSGQPVNLWTGMCTVPVAVTLRHRTAYVDLTGLAKMRWVTRASGFHVVRPLVKLADGSFLVGDHAESPTTTFVEREFSFTGLRWMALDVKRVVTTGQYGPVGEASNWIALPNLSKVDEIGFVDLMPGSGHGSGGWVNVGTIEVYGRPLPREGASASNR